jgi:hypothetical protein
MFLAEKKTFNPNYTEEIRIWGSATSYSPQVKGKRAVSDEEKMEKTI